VTAVAIRPATPQDLDQIMALETEAFPHGWSRQAWAEEVRDHFVAVACSPESHICGVVVMSSVADTAELLRVIVGSGVRRTGLGRALVAHGLAWAETQGAQEVFLEVSAGNPAGIGLYESCGFGFLDRRTHYYGPGDDALIYRARVGAEEEICLNR